MPASPNRTMTPALIFIPIVLLLLACAGLLGTPMEQMEGSYESRLDSLQDLRARAAGDTILEQEVDAERAAFEQQYEALPTDEQARTDALGVLNQTMRQKINDLEPKVVTIEAAALAAAQAEGAKIRSTFDGTWMAPGIVLKIDPGGQVHYENKTSTVSKNIDAPIQSFTPQRFTVGIFGITTTFTIDEAPHQESEGTWKMKLDGIEYTRQ